MQELSNLIGTYMWCEQQLEALRTLAPTSYDAARHDARVCRFARDFGIAALEGLTHLDETSERAEQCFRHASHYALAHCIALHKLVASEALSEAGLHINKNKRRLFGDSNQASYHHRTAEDKRQEARRVVRGNITHGIRLYQESIRLSQDAANRIEEAPRYQKVLFWLRVLAVLLGLIGVIFAALRYS